MKMVVFCLSIFWNKKSIRLDTAGQLEFYNDRVRRFFEYFHIVKMRLHGVILLDGRDDLTKNYFIERGDILIEIRGINIMKPLKITASIIAIIASLFTIHSHLKTKPATSDVEASLQTAVHQKAGSQPIPEGPSITLLLEQANSASTTAKKTPASDACLRFPVSPNLNYSARGTCVLSIAVAFEEPTRYNSKDIHLMPYALPPFQR